MNGKTKKLNKNNATKKEQGEGNRKKTKKINKIGKLRLDLGIEKHQLLQILPQQSLSTIIVTNMSHISQPFIKKHQTK